MFKGLDFKPDAGLFMDVLSELGGRSETSKAVAVICAMRDVFPDINLDAKPAKSLLWTS